MVTKQEYAQLSLYVYNVTGLDENRPDLPSPAWTRLEYHPDDAIGFSYGIFQNSATHEVVVAYTGTNEKKVADFLLANLSTGVGLSSLQVNAAARVAANAIDTYGASKVTFTGHSLGGGLASIMGVWFDRPATLFDAAPFEFTARNPLAVESARNWITLTTGLSNAALNSFEVLGNFSQREVGVTSYYTSEEALQLLRMALPTVAGTELRVEFGVDNMLTRRIDLHSQALLTAGLMSDSFREATIAVQRSIPLMLDGDLYAYDAASSSKRNLLIDLIRSDQTTPANGKLTHFAADLQKLGTNIAGLNQAAQDALIAQGIEWYYWQGTDYAGQEFFTQNGALLQYTSNQGDITSLDRSANKAAPYTTAWLNPLVQADGGYSVSFKYEQWNVVAGAIASTAMARDNAKSQVFVGGSGADTFTGGGQNDMLLGGAGADDLKGGAGMDFLFGGADTDTLDGGLGSDWLYGGTGFDAYQLRSGELLDVIIDSDGNGTLTVDGIQLTGGKRAAPGYWISDDRQWGYALTSGGDLVIAKGSSPDRITVRGWSTLPGNHLGITLDDSNAPPATTTTLTGDFKKQLTGSGTAFLIGADGNYIPDGAQPGAPDLITGTAGADSIQGLGGDDALAGGEGDDFIEGGDGNDVLMGGLGADFIQGGAGVDLIYGSSTGALLYSTSATTQPPAPTYPVLLGQGLNWVRDSPGPDAEGFLLGYLSDTITRDQQAGDAGNVIDGGAGISPESIADNAHPTLGRRLFKHHPYPGAKTRRIARGHRLRQAPTSTALHPGRGARVFRTATLKDHETQTEV